MAKKHGLTESKDEPGKAWAWFVVSYCLAVLVALVVACGVEIWRYYAA